MSHFATDLGRVAHSLPDALVMLESDGTISWLNQATLDLMGIVPLDWSGASFGDLIHHDDRPERIDELGTNVTEFRVRDGRSGWRRLEIRSRTIPGGARPGFVVVSLRDAA
ncbi:MAG: PAS domain-containing protein [Acidimicrobiales bacterium]